MLRIFHGNRIEALVEHLARKMQMPLADPLCPDRVVVQNPGMAQWLTQQLAERLGICANIDFPLPANFIWGVFEVELDGIPAENLYHRDILTWRCMDHLPRLMSDPAFTAVRNYLEDDTDGRKCYRLSRRCAGLFDQYQVYRPEWINQWDGGAGDHWQARLWRAISPAGAPGHRAALLEAFLKRVRSGRLDPSALPERVSLFGLSALAPAYLEVLAAISRRVQVDFYVLNPSLAYWGDITSDRDLARRRDLWRRLGREDVSGYFEVGHPLLASLGNQGREFFEQLQDLECPEEELFADPGDGCRLHRLQQDILLLRDRRADRGRAAGGEADDSLQIHGSHSDLREVQVLQDRLLALFEELPGLLPRDVVVMAPDISRFAPHVEAVFDTTPGPRRIPYSMADRGAGEADPLLQGALTLLSLPQGRLEASTVLGLLDLPALRRRFRLTADDLPEIHQWVRDSGIRWGLDESDRGAAGVTASDRNTWRFGLDRLLLGYAMPDGADAVNGVLPLPGIEGGGAAGVGALGMVVETLARWRRQLAEPCTAARWRDRMNALVDDFFAPVGDEGLALQDLRLLLDDLVRQDELAGTAVDLTPEVFRDVVRECLEDRDGGQGFLAGQVTFCNMVPMRSIPFRVVCLLGMNDLEFPRIQRPPGFDLMAAERRRGDRSRRDDDRYLFLEALLCARDVFYVSYQSRDIRDNSERVPSVVVSDLVDYLARAEGETASGLMVQHPLQPFSHRYFSGDHRLFSYAAQWLPGATEPAAPFAHPPLPEPEPEWRSVDLAALVDFFTNPARYLLRRRLGVHLAAGDAIVEDREPFLLDSLESYLLRQQILQSEAALDRTAVKAWLEASGRAPHGPFARFAADHLLAPLRPMMTALEAIGAAPAEPLEVDLALGAFALAGWLENVRPTGLLRYRPAKVKARDRLALWIEHLALCAMDPPGIEPSSRLLMLDQDLVYRPVAEPRPVLADLLELYWQGLSSPLPFFAESSWAYAAAMTGGKGREAALRAAWSRWLDGYAHNGEGGDEYIDTAWRGTQPINEDFESVALRILEPLMGHVGA